MIKKPKGKLGVLTPGMGAVASTFFAGVIAVRKGISQPIGSLTQMGDIRLVNDYSKRNADSSWRHFTNHTRISKWKYDIYTIHRLGRQHNCANSNRL